MSRVKPRAMQKVILSRIFMPDLILPCHMLQIVKSEHSHIDVKSSPPRPAKRTRHAVQ